MKMTKENAKGTVLLFGAPEELIEPFFLFTEPPYDCSISSQGGRFGYSNATLLVRCNSIDYAYFRLTGTIDIVTAGISLRFIEAKQKVKMIKFLELAKAARDKGVGLGRIEKLIKRSYLRSKKITIEQVIGRAVLEECKPKEAKEW